MKIYMDDVVTAPDGWTLAKIATIDWERITAAEKQFIATLEYFGNKAVP